LDGRHGGDGEREHGVRVGFGSVGDGAGCVEVRGKHFERNRRKKQNRRDREKVPEWRRTAAPLSSSAASVVTVDSRTAEEIEAARTLAKKRVAENLVAEQIAQHRLASLQDKAKTAAVRELQVQRLNERINTAKARSQAKYKECDNSLKSLGSAGSAGEFAWKKTATENESLRELVENQKQQLERALAAGGPAVCAAVAEVPEPRQYGIRDALGEPTDDWTEDEVSAFFDILNAEAIGKYDTKWEDFFPASFWERKSSELF